MFIKNKIMVSLKKYIIKWLKILQTPIVKEFPFFLLFLLAITIMPIRFIPSHVHYFFMNRVFDFFFIDFPRAGAISYLFTLFVFYIRNRFIKISLYTFALLLFAVCLFLHLVFNKTLQPDIITLIVETNKREASEFLYSFLLSKGGILTLIFLIFYVVLVVLCERKKDKITLFLKSLKHEKIINLLLSAFIFCGFLQFGFYKDIVSVSTIDDMPEEYGCRDSITTLFYSLYNIYLVNLEMKHAVDVTCCAKLSHVSVDDSLNVVYVIGESYIKCHSQLYGYYLPTTPNLYQEKKKGNLFVFDNVVSPFNSTTLTMKNTLCCNSLRNHEKWSDSPYFPALFKKAGYQVYFWDVQKDDELQAPFVFSMNTFVYNRLLMKESYTQISKNVFEYDNQAVVDFSKEAKGIGKHNLVIFHLMGQHVMATKRYPHISQFNVFSYRDIRSKQPYLNDEKKQMIAEYDNATLYNDYVLKNIIDLFRDKNTVVLYFSDHGEEIYDYRDSYGRVVFDDNMKNLGYKYQYEVPFMIWCSDKYKKKYPAIINNIKKALHRSFRTDEICNVVFHISQLNTPYYRDKYDLLSPSFVPLDSVSQSMYN